MGELLGAAEWRARFTRVDGSTGVIPSPRLSRRQGGNLPTSVRRRPMMYAHLWLLTASPGQPFLCT
jgi:hypothetical protein